MLYIFFAHVLRVSLLKLNWSSAEDVWSNQSCGFCPNAFFGAAAVSGGTPLLLRGTQLFIGCTALNADIRGGSVVSVGPSIASSE